MMCNNSINTGVVHTSEYNSTVYDTTRYIFVLFVLGVVGRGVRRWEAGRGGGVFVLFPSSDWCSQQQQQQQQTAARYSSSVRGHGMTCVVRSRNLTLN